MMTEIMLWLIAGGCAWLVVGGDRATAIYIEQNKDLHLVKVWAVSSSLLMIALWPITVGYALSGIWRAIRERQQR